MIFYSLKMPKQDLQCPFCPKTSSRGTGLASHIRGAHPKQYPGWSKARKGGQKAAAAQAMPAETASGGLSGIIASLEQQRDAIEAALSALRAVGDTVTSAQVKQTVAPEASAGKRKKFSAASRKRMALAQKARWAKIKGEAQRPARPAPEPSTPKRRISPEGIKRIIAATKKRWRLKRGAAKAASAAA